MKQLARRLSASLMFVAAIALAAGCGVLPRLEHGEASPEELTIAVLLALEKRDEARLRQLALSEEEFRSLVWPELPASRPERNLPFSLVWNDLRVKSDASLAGTLHEYGGQKFILSDIWFRGGSTQHESYVLHTNPTLRVIDTAKIDHEIRLFGSIFEQGGQFKVFSYIVD